jgi:hypothetical protein
MHNEELRNFSLMNIIRVIERRSQVVDTPPLSQEVPDSNSGPKTGYPDWDFLWFSSVFSSECLDIALN